MLGAGDELLRRLSSGPRPDAGRARAPRLPLEGMGFQELLSHTGGIGGGAPIAVQQDLNLELSEQARERLGRIADQAAATGLARIVAIIGSHVIELDTGRRVILRSIGDSGDQPIVGIDGLAVLTDHPAHDQLFGVGLHGPRPAQGNAHAASHAASTEHSHDLSGRPVRSGASIAGVSGAHSLQSPGLIELLAALESDKRPALTTPPDTNDTKE